MAYLRKGPLQAHRIADARYDILDGGGAAHYGARWNSPGRFVIYAALTYEGAVLEKIVHANTTDVPDNQVAAIIDISADADIEVLQPADLPADWFQDEAVTKTLGDQWYNDQRTPVLMVPSAPTRLFEKNLLINQRHPGFHKINAGTPSRALFDERLFRQN